MCINLYHIATELVHNVHLISKFLTLAAKLVFLNSWKCHFCGTKEEGKRNHAQPHSSQSHMFPCQQWHQHCVRMCVRMKDSSAVVLHGYQTLPANCKSYDQSHDHLTYMVINSSEITIKQCNNAYIWKCVHKCCIIFYILLKKADFYFHAVHRVKCVVTFVVYFIDYSINNSIYVELQNYLFDTFYRNHFLINVLINVVKQHSNTNVRSSITVALGKQVGK